MARAQVGHGVGAAAGFGILRQRPDPRHADGRAGVSGDRRADQLGRFRVLALIGQRAGIVQPGRRVLGKPAQGILQQGFFSSRCRDSVRASSLM
ncbi:hypothetical protein [Paracoccus sp. N5]|uniref:hypothetical protein n=1 Tax=Paracoccus sp. N5 TaxID=1101189 RepID=UPI00036D04EE|nr:hypothetical protein [Paracoccus sp. N5]